MRIAIGIPILSSLPGEAIKSIIDGCIEASKFGEVVLIDALDLVPYDRARNYLVGTAIEENCDLFWAIDADCVVPEGAFKELFDTLEATNAQAVLAHNYMRGYPYVCSWFSENPDGGFVRVDAGSGVHQIRSGAFHCCLFDLNWVKENLEEPFFKYNQDEDDKKKIMEDAYFFSQMGKKDGKVVGNANVRCGHVYTRVILCDKTVKVLRKLQAEMIGERDV